MDILIDTCTFIWLAQTPEELSKKTRALCHDSESTLFLSTVSAAEIGLKYQMRKLYIPNLPSVFIPRERMEHGILSLSLDEESSLLLESLPPLHKDPFDRLLICQALAHDLTILTPDRNIRKYEVKTAW